MNDLNNSVLSEDLTPAEAAYIQSRGEDTTALEKELTQSPAATQPQGTETTPNPAETQPSGEDDEITITIGPDGRPRDAKTGKWVPHGAFHKERELRKTPQNENVSMREMLARADERLNILNQIIGAQEPTPTPQEEQPIDPETDIFGAFKQAMTKIDTLQKKLSERDQRGQTHAVEQNLVQVYQQDAVRFLKEKPDFKDAYFHLVNARHKELEALGIADQGQRNALTAQEEKGLVAQALQARKGPAQVIYQLALARGFAARGVSPDGTSAGTSNSALTPEPNPVTVQKIEAIKQGQQKTASLSSAGGSPGQGMTLEALANMSEEDFLKKVGHLGRSQLRKLLGE